jgi:hypothetical protein
MLDGIIVVSFAVATSKAKRTNLHLRIHRRGREKK